MSFLARCAIRFENTNLKTNLLSLFDIVVFVVGMVPGIIHYLWCGNRWFGFKQYLALDSAVKAIKPDKVRTRRDP